MKLEEHSVLRSLIVAVCGVASLAMLSYILWRSVQPFPLDAFEEYEIWKADRWLQGESLYGSPETEVVPEAYPPLYFWMLGVWLRCFGASFVAARALSLAALAGIAAAGWWAVRDRPQRLAAYAVFLTALLSFHPLTDKFYEIAKPDCLFAFLVGLAIVCGAHRTPWEAAVSSVALWLASLTKQNAPIFLVPMCLAHWLAGHRRWALAWGAAMLLAIVVSYALLELGSGGHFFHWAVVWTGGHGVDFRRGGVGLLEAIGRHGPILAAVLIGSCMVGFACRWSGSLVVALVLALLGMAKSGGRANHLLPAAFIAAVLLARWVADLGLAPGGAVRSWLVRWAMLLMLGVTIAWGLPARRDFRWLGKRAGELDGWMAAVAGLEGRVAVGHFWLLARQAGADCFFSDLILEFPGLRVPESVRSRIERREFDYLLLSEDPQSSTTAEWTDLIGEMYEPAGDLAFEDISHVLPSRLYRAR